MDMAEVMYVAHAVGGDVETNVKRIIQICKKYHSRDVIPFAPYLLALQYLDDASPDDRLLGTEANREYFRRRAMDKVGVFGERVSKGVFDELVWSRQYGIPVEAMEEAVSVEVDYALSCIDRRMNLASYLEAERKLSNGNALFFRRDKQTKNCNDIVLIESDILVDAATGRDVTRFNPTIIAWDEISDGWNEIEKRSMNLSPSERSNYREDVINRITQLYDEERYLEIHELFEAA